MSLQPQQLEALKTAGGCDHTPDPFRACDVCGRPAIPGRPSGFVAYNFQAVTIDGDILDKKDVISFLNLPLDRVCRVQVMTDSPQIPTIRLGCDPTKDERLLVFTRHTIRLGVGGVPGGKLSIVVLEVRRLRDGSFTRLYLHPDMGPILTTEDLYF